jgi:hypothetical protein
MAPRRFSVSSTDFKAVMTGQIRPVATVAMTSTRWLLPVPAMWARTSNMGAVGSEPRTSAVSNPDSATEQLSRFSCSPPMRLKENSDSRSISSLSAASA